MLTKKYIYFKHELIIFRTLKVSNNVLDKRNYIQDPNTSNKCIENNYIFSIIHKINASLRFIVKLYKKYYLLVNFRQYDIRTRDACIDIRKHIDEYPRLILLKNQLNACYYIK